MKNNRFKVFLILQLVVALILNIVLINSIVESFNLEATTPISSRVVRDSIILNTIVLLVVIFFTHYVAEKLYNIIKRTKHNKVKQPIDNIVSRNSDHNTIFNQGYKAAVVCINDRLSKTDYNTVNISSTDRSDIRSLAYYVWYKDLDDDSKVYQFKPLYNNEQTNIQSK